MTTLNTVGQLLHLLFVVVANKAQFRNFLVNTTSWATQQAQILTTSTYGIAIMKGSVISIMTNIGSPVRVLVSLTKKIPHRLTRCVHQPQNGTHIAVSSPYPQNTAMVKYVFPAFYAFGTAS